MDRRRQFPAETWQKWEYKASPRNRGAAPHCRAKGFSEISRGPSVSAILCPPSFRSSSPFFPILLSLPLPLPLSHSVSRFNHGSFSHGIPAFPLIFHRSRTDVAAAAILLPGPGAPEAAGCAATKRRCGKITGLWSVDKQRRNNLCSRRRRRTDARRWKTLARNYIYAASAGISSVETGKPTVTSAF